MHSTAQNRKVKRTTAPNAPPQHSTARDTGAPQGVAQLSPTQPSTTQDNTAKHTAPHITVQHIPILCLTAHLIALQRYGMEKYNGAQEAAQGSAKLPV